MQDIDIQRMYRIYMDIITVYIHTMDNYTTHYIYTTVIQ